jgi:hypothetical protein
MVTDENSRPIIESSFNLEYTIIKDGYPLGVPGNCIDAKFEYFYLNYLNAPLKLLGNFSSNTSSKAPHVSSKAVTGENSEGLPSSKLPSVKISLKDFAAEITEDRKSNLKLSSLMFSFNNSVELVLGKILINDSTFGELISDDNFLYACL